MMGKEMEKINLADGFKDKPLLHPLLEQIQKKDGSIEQWIKNVPTETIHLYADAISNEDNTQDKEVEDEIIQTAVFLCLKINSSPDALDGQATDEEILHLVKVIKSLIAILCVSNDINFTVQGPKLFEIKYTDKWLPNIIIMLPKLLNSNTSIIAGEEKTTCELSPTEKENRFITSNYSRDKKTNKVVYTS